MAEAVGLAASVIAIIDLSAKVAVLCLDYSTAVGNARADITRLRHRLDDLGTTLQGVRHLLDDPSSQALATSRRLVDSVDACTSELAQLQSRLDPGKARKAMRRFGIRALKWPFDSKEVSDIVSNLERYERTITLGLQIDQTTLLLDIRQRIEGVSLQPEEDVSIARKPCFSLPFERDPDFVDRPYIMAWIKDQYTGPVGRMALVGMGGFGYEPEWLTILCKTIITLTGRSKSQVAIQFAHHVRDTSPQTSVFWVHASSKPRFEEAYRSIADNLRLPRRNDPSVDVLGLVRDWLQREEAGPWLMVLDNVDDVNLFNPTPAPEEMGHMDAAEKLTGSHKAVYGISAMDDAQALLLFRNKLQGDSDKNAAADLLRALDYIPLAITQAAAYINRRAPRISVKTYLDTFRESNKKKGSLLNSDAGDLRRDETVSNSVVTTWQVTLEQIRRERPSAANLLSLMSFFNPQGIPEFVLHNYKGELEGNVDRDEDRDEFEDDLDVLCGYSLVSVTATRDVCEMHSLVQFCTRAWLSMVDDAERWRQVFLWAMSRHFPSGAFETWPTCQMLLPHIESMLEEEPPNEDLQKWALLLTNCARYMFTIGNYRAARKLGDKAVKTRASVLGEEHPDTLSSMNNLALTYRNQGRWKEAEELQVRVMETRANVLGEQHPDTLTSMGNLTVTYMNQGRWKEAEELQVRVMETTKNALGEQHPSTLSSMANLASTYWNQGRWKEAEELDLRVMETRKTVLGEEHPDTLTSMANLASTYRNQGRWKKAEELDLRVMETRKTVLGEEHPKMLSSMANLALTYWNQGRWKEAEELQVRVMETTKNVLGEQHPSTLTSMNNLAIIWKDQGRSRDALALMRNCVVLRERVLDIDHPDAASSAATLANWEEASDLS
ncbi:hypothetical protein BGZ61DRAFT_485518 [Ilyonectria robusta]|uniref:uncharacterized protein n=1 Tax=Ilyonectria robusta TaxID=1079257 RepID=UPI001E8D494E|nr:uncharacterized protein BGZ61DRAFT_485518 [Ilyonectria robusta]KAH8661168.1 hypothetical protein BGZ61DRAFT_485518 [Ilyonectria robusta]